MRLLALAGLGVLAVSIACGKPPPPKPPPAPEEEKEPEGPELPDQYIERGQLEVVLVREGPAWVLSQVPIEAVLENDEFVGWRIVEMPVAWKEVELQPGDVVTSVNAMPLETPSDLWAAWTTLSVASELKVSYLRHGEEHELSLPIIGSPSPEVSGMLKQQQGTPPSEPPPSGRGPKREETIVIEGDDRPITDTNVDYGR